MNRADTRIKRLPERGSTDFQTACDIIDAAKVCHVGFSLQAQPYVLPMACARRERDLLLHGSTASRLMQALAGGAPCCATITHVDGLVLARSAFHSSMNYRSVMVFGQARLVEDEEDKSACLNALVEHLLPGRRAELRDSTRKEIAATAVLALPIETFSVKTRSGPPDDPKGDIGLPLWAGTIPLGTVAGAPEPAPNLASDIPPPDYLRNL